MPAQTEEILLVHAQQSMRDNQFQAALDLFRQVLVIAPENNLAQKGYQEAALQLALEENYAAGIAALEAKDYAKALELFTTLQQMALNYRDVARLLAKTQALVKVEQLFAAGQSAYNDQQWPAVIQTYEALRQIDSTYEAEVVISRLGAAYVQAGRQIVALAPKQGTDLRFGTAVFPKCTGFEWDGRQRANREQPPYGLFGR